MKHESSRGIVLLATCVLLVIVTVLLAAVLGYVSFATRFTADRTGASVCRLAAQTAIEVTKQTICDKFYASPGMNRVTIGKNAANDAFLWFDSYSSMRIGSSPTIIFPTTTNINGCVVRVRIGKVLTPHESSSARLVVLRASASCSNANNQRSSSAIEETVLYSLDRSAVFNYAYFVNNFGWMNGTSIYLNGPARSNGDFTFYSDALSTVNGDVYAAQNDELNSSGAIDTVMNMQTRSQYWNNAPTSARPTSPAAAGGTTVSGGYNAPTTALTSDEIQEQYVHPEQTTIPMPYVSDLQNYIDYAKEQGGTVSIGGVTKINAYYNGVGPSGNASLSDNGSIVLVGTAASPIVLNGPVVVASDVVIKGYVTGNGVIYSGRNIHIVGSIRYVNAPSWSHPDTDYETTAEKNSNADMLGLVAKGNIVIGNCTSESWLASVEDYISTPFVKSYAVDASDANIGYGDGTASATFNGDYTAYDKNYDGTGGKKVVATTVELDTGHYEYRRGRAYWVPDTETTYADSQTRHYYDSVVDADTLSGLCESVIRIDGVLYNNHAVMGTPGAYGYNTMINGSMICRDDALVMASGSRNMYFNWDIRLNSGANGNAKFSSSLPLGPASVSRTINWRVVPESLIGD